MKASANHWNNHKMVRFTASIYRNQKRVGTRFRLCSILTRGEKQQALGKHHYDDSEIKGNFDFACTAIGRKGRNALARAEAFWTDNRFRYESYTKPMTIRQVIEQINRYKTIVKRKFRVKYITEPLQYLYHAYQLYIYAEDEKSWSGIGRFCWEH